MQRLTKERRNHSLSTHAKSDKSLSAYSSLVQRLDVNDKKTRSIIDDLIKHTLKLAPSPTRSRTSILPFLRSENSPYPAEDVYAGDDFPLMEVFESRGEGAHLPHAHARTSLGRAPTRLGRSRPTRTSSTRFEENLDLGEIDSFISQHNDNARNVRRRTSTHDLLARTDH